MERQSLTRLREGAMAVFMFPIVTLYIIGRGLLLCTAYLTSKYIYILMFIQFVLCIIFVKFFTAELGAKVGRRW